MIHPTPTEARAAQANHHERMAATLPTDCAWCGEHFPLLDGPVNHTICEECAAVMEAGADEDADDQALVLIAVRALLRAQYDAAIWPTAENTDRKSRAHNRVIRLLDKAIEPLRPRPSDERRTLVQGEEGAGARKRNPAPAKGPARSSAHTETKSSDREAIPTGAGDDAARMRHAVTTHEV